MIQPRASSQSGALAVLHRELLPADRTGRRYVLLACVLLSLGAAGFAALLIDPLHGGTSHDDGIYVATAESLARTGQYRLVNLPTEPPQTKYPPLYPALLSVIVAVAPEFPASIWYLKILNVAALLVLGYLTSLAALKLGGLTPLERVLAVGLTVTNPGIFSLADSTLSDLVFACFIISFLLVWKEQDGAPRARQLLLAGLLGGLCVLTRSIGVALIAAGLWRLGVRRAWTRVLVFASAAATLVGPWAWWQWSHRISNPGPLLDYYVSYEQSMYARLLSHPGEAARVMLANVYLVWTDLPLVLAAGPSVLRALILVLVVGGLLRLGRRGLPGAAAFVAFYVAALAGYAYATPRYTVPLVPVEYLALAVATSELRRAANQRSVTVRPVLLGLAIAPVVVLLAANLMWLQRFATMPATQFHGTFGRPMPFPWTGYAEVIEWIRANTRPTDVIASGNDPMYHLYTRRHTVRPWVNRPMLYFPLYGVRADTSGDPALVLREFDRLGVTYFVDDPSLPDPEGVHAKQTVAGFLALGNWQQVHVTSDGGHVIWRRSPGP